MDSLQSPLPSPSNLSLTPIVVSMLAIAATAAAILIYHYLLSICCRRRSPAISSRRNIRSHHVAGGVAGGVAEDVLKSLPVRVYSIKHSGSFREDQTECAVCMGELDEGDQIRLLPTCRHVFHLQCIDQWFASHSSCPICRLEITAPSSPHLVLQVADNVAQIQAQSISVSDEASDCGRIRSQALLNRCTSLLSTIERKSPRPNTRLNRSFSMGTSRLSDKKHVDLEVGIPAEAPGVTLLISSQRRGSFRWLDRGSFRFNMSLSRQ